MSQAPTPHRRLEFWPAYSGLVLHEDGLAVALDSLSLPVELADRAARWVSQYDDAPLDPASRDETWIAEGTALFVLRRDALAAKGIELFDWEGYWAGDSN